MSWMLNGRSERQRHVMGQTLEPAAAGVGSGLSLVSPRCVRLSKAPPSLSLRFLSTVSRVWAERVLSCSAAQNQQLEATGSWPYFCKVSMAQWTLEAFQLHCSTPVFNEATSGVYLL